MPESDPWRIAAALVTAASLTDQLNLLLEEAPRVGGGDSATIYLRDDPTGTLQVAAQFGYSTAFTGPRSRGLTHHVLETGQALVVHDTTTDPRINPVVIAAGLRSLVALPLVVRRRIEPGVLESGGRPETPGPRPEPIGVLYVNARRLNAFDGAAVAALKGLAALASVAIENGLLLEAQRVAAGHLAQALQLREQFVSVASHELKSPLTPLKGYAQAISRRLDRATAEHPLDEAWLRRALGIMLGQIDRLDQLVTDLLDVSRVRIGRFSIAPEALDLVEFAHSLFVRFQETLVSEEASGEAPGETPTGAASSSTAGADAAVRHVFSWRAPVDTLPGQWDPHRLDQLLTNLLGNAVKYSPAGGCVELLVEPAPLSGPACAALQRHAPSLDPPIGPIGPGWVHLAVRDEGIGLTGGLPVKADGHRDLFEPFARGTNVLAAHFSGFGLGLFICAQIVHHHGGVIWAESPGEGHGSTFHVLLPPAPP